MCTLSRPGAITVDPHREFPALPEEVLLQILHPFADSIQHYAEEIAVYHRPALADDACKLTTPSSISVRQISDPGRQKLHLHPGYPRCTCCDIRGLATPISQPLPWWAAGRAAAVKPEPVAARKALSKGRR